MSEEMNRDNMNHEDRSNQKNDSQESNQYSFWAEKVAISQAKSNSESNQPTGKSDRLDKQDVINEEYNSAQAQVNFTMEEPKKSEGRQGYHPNYSQVFQNQYTNDSQEMNASKQSKPKKELPKSVRTFYLAATAGIVAAGCFIGVLATYRHLTNDNNVFRLPVIQASNNISNTEILETAVVPNTNVTKVYQDVLPSIVAIDSTISEAVNFFGQTFEQETPGSGSGIIVGKTDTELLIATNNHVVDGASKIEVTFIDGSTIEGITKGTDASADLAVVSIDISTIKAETLKQIKVATLGNSNKVKEGEMAIAIGNALGYGQSITVGYISAVNREVTLDSGKMTLLQTDAAINPGNSGGALINEKGEVIGINSAKLAAASIEGIGYAIPISYASPILDELMSREIIKEADQGYLGVKIRDITEEIANAYGWPVGVYVMEVTDNSAAKKAGIQERDIITAVDGVEVTTSTALIEKVSSYKYDTKVKVTVQRNVNGELKEMVIDVTLGKKPVTNEKK